MLVKVDGNEQWHNMPAGMRMLGEALQEKGVEFTITRLDREKSAVELTHPSAKFSQVVARHQESDCIQEGIDRVFDDI